MVGSFNYRNPRLSSRPAILVEQAFATHAEAEELLASDEFRTRIAEQTYAGIADYATQMLTGGTEGTADGRRPR